MVSFILDPRIKQSQEQRRLSLAQMLKGYKPPPNPYGYTAAGHLGPLVHALGAHLSGKRAGELQTAQLGAQSDLMAQILSLGEMPTGDTYTVADDGRVTPVQYTPEQVVFDPATVKAAGAREPELRLAAQQAQVTARGLYDARRKTEIDNAIIQAYQDGDEEAVSALRLLRDPIEATKPESGKPTFTQLATPMAEPGEGVTAYPDGSMVIWRYKGGKIVGTPVPPPGEAEGTPGELLSVSEVPSVGDGPDVLPTIAERTAQAAFLKKKATLLAATTAVWPQLVAKRRNLQNETEQVIKTAKEAIALIASDPSVTGIAAFALKNLPGTPARTLRNKLRKLGAYAGFSTLGEMRATTPTGASGLGALSREEMELLISKKFTGDQEMKAEDLILAINDLIDNARATLAIGNELHNNIASTYDLTVGGEPAAPTETVPQNEVDALIDRYGSN